MENFLKKIRWGTFIRVPRVSAFPRFMLYRQVLHSYRNQSIDLQVQILFNGFYMSVEISSAWYSWSKHLFIADKYNLRFIANFKLQVSTLVSERPLLFIKFSFSGQLNCAKCKRWKKIFAEIFNEKLEWRNCLYMWVVQTQVTS